MPSSGGRCSRNIRPRSILGGVETTSTVTGASPRGVEITTFGEGAELEGGGVGGMVEPSSRFTPFEHAARASGQASTRQRTYERYTTAGPCARAQVSGIVT